MGHDETQILLIKTLERLESKIESLNDTVGELSTEVALLKRDKAWARWLIGIASSVSTLVLGAVFTKITKGDLQ